MTKNKRPMLIDFDIGIVGTFVAADDADEPEYKIIKYIPLNSFTSKIIEYRDPIHKDDFHHWHPPRSSIEGVEDTYVVVGTGKDASMIGKIEMKSTDLVKKLRDKIKDQEITIATLKQEVQDASAGVQKQQARYNESKAKSPDRSSILNRRPWEDI